MEINEDQVIALAGGRKSLVDREDFDKVSSISWYFHHTGDMGGYARGYYNGKLVYMHRLIMGFPEKVDIDHINGDKLDNRKCNLRIATRGQNMSNSLLRKANKASIYKGVSWDKKKGKWYAQIQQNKKNYFIGYFEKEYWAAMARDIWSKEMHGKFALLNFKPIC